MAVRPWRTNNLPDLVGAKEAAEILGIQKMTLKRWMEPGSGKHYSSHGTEHTFMITPKRIASGPVWVKEDVERFRDEIGRQRAPMGSTADASK